MYFSQEQVKTLLSILAGAFSEFVLLAELMPPMAVKQAKHHDTLKSTQCYFPLGHQVGKRAGGAVSRTDLAAGKQL